MSTTIKLPPAPKVRLDEARDLVIVESAGPWPNHRFAPYSQTGRALLELIARREAEGDLTPDEESPLRSLVGYAADTRAEIAEAIGQCSTNGAAEALTQALAHLNAVVCLCEAAVVKDAS